MRILHILKTEPEESIKKVIGEHKKHNEIQVVELSKNKDYNLVVELIEKADKVITW